MDGAGSQVRPWALNVRARSTRWPAYEVPPVPSSRTMSSQAYSLSRRSRAHAIQNSGLNQLIARSISADSWISQSRRTRCAISCASTSRMRSAGQLPRVRGQQDHRRDHSPGDEQRRMRRHATRTGRRMPKLPRARPPRLLPLRAGVDAREVSHVSHATPISRMARLTVTPAAQT